MPALLTPARRDVTTTPPAPIDDITRRDLLRGIGALGAGWVLAGCATDSQDARSDPQRTRTVRHLFGELSLTGVPERIVTVNDRCEFESLLSLGVRPHATGVVDGDAPWQAGLDLDGVETFPGVQTLAGEIDVEALLVQEPDILIGPAGSAEPEDVQVLADAVPLFVTAASQPAPFGWWQDVLEQMAEIVERSDRVPAIVAEVDEALDRAAERFATLGLREVSLFSVYETGPYLFSDFNPQGALLERLGLERPSEQRERFIDPQERGGYELSMERIGELDTDVLLLMDYVPAATDELEASELFRSLPAVADGRYLRLSPELSFGMFFHSPISLPWVVDQLLELLTDTAALD